MEAVKYFKKILLKNPHQHPLIYLTGMNAQNLQAVLEFIYLGEVKIPKSRVISFIKTAKELQVEGLTAKEDNIEEGWDEMLRKKFNINECGECENGIPHECHLDKHR